MPSVWRQFLLERDLHALWPGASVLLRLIPGVLNAVSVIPRRHHSRCVVVADYLVQKAVHAGRRTGRSLPLRTGTMTRTSLGVPSDASATTGVHRVYAGTRPDRHGCAWAAAARARIGAATADGTSG